MQYSPRKQLRSLKLSRSKNKISGHGLQDLRDHHLRHGLRAGLQDLQDHLRHLQADRRTIRG